MTTVNSTNPGAVPTHEEIDAKVGNWLDRTADRFRRTGDALRGFIFFLYLIFAFISFWLWLAGAIFGLLRAVPRVIARFLLFLADGVPEIDEEPDLPLGERLQRHSAHAWDRRDLVYERYSTPAARSYLATRTGFARFMGWGIVRKVTFLVVAFFLFVLPMAYVVPRPIYVQLIDDNAINVNDGVTHYLIHGVGLFNYKTYELQNTPNWVLLKFNPQGLQNRLHEGRYYRLWIVGLRWYVPQLYPNIVGATEVDAQGNTIKNPVPFIPPTAPNATYPVLPGG